MDILVDFPCIDISIATLIISNDTLVNLTTTTTSLPIIQTTPAALRRRPTMISLLAATTTMMPPVDLLDIDNDIDIIGADLVVP